MQACHWMRAFDLITLEILIFLTWNKKKLLPLFFYSLRLGLVNWRFSLAKILASHWLIAFGLITNPLFVPWQKTQYFLSYRVKCSQPMRSQNFGQTKPSIDKLTIARHCIENTKIVVVHYWFHEKKLNIDWFIGSNALNQWEAIISAKPNLQFPNPSQLLCRQ